MRYHWPELEALTVIRIAPAEEGPTSEEDRMWMEEGFMNEMEPEAAKAVTKRKGLVSLELREPNATHNELSIILRDVSHRSVLKFHDIKARSDFFVFLVGNDS